MKLTDSKNIPTAPLAERCRPKSLNTFVGQEHLVGNDGVIAKQIQTGIIHSMILWGPPGVGKTTLARIISNELSYEFYTLSAVTSGVADIRKIIAKAKKQKKGTILFVDEIHRFNKAQQDALLHSVEDGTLKLIGATTENPSFEVISPLLSRCRVYTLKPLEREDLHQILVKALEEDEWLGTKNVSIKNNEILLDLAGGDARRLLNILEVAVSYVAPDEKGVIQIAKSTLEKAAQQKVFLYDKAGENHYDIISAFIKSVRGSDPDAAVYWLARMLAGGEDPKFIARRLVILASEDIGNANPTALVLATSTFQSVHMVGMPEARIILSQATTYLASSPKSNASYLAIEEAAKDVEKYNDLPVPFHLRNASTSLMREMDYGKGYKYSHDYQNHFVEQDYLPELLKDRLYYKPTDEGREKQLSEFLKRRWKKRKKD